MRESPGSNKRRATIAVFYLGYKKNVRYPGRSSYPRMTWSHQSTDTDKSLVCLYTGPRHRCLGFLHTHRYLQIGESRKEIGIEKERDKRKRKKTYFKAKYANNEGKAHISFKEEVRTEFTLSLMNKQVQFRTALLQETEQFSPINPSIAWISVCKSVSVN